MSHREARGSEAELWQLIEQRAAPGADVARIDERIWDLFGESWAILFTDLSGFSRQVAAFGIVHFLQIIFENKRLFSPIIARHGGILVKTEADSLLVIFERASAALTCAIEMQRASQKYNESRAPEDKVLLCAGVGFGRILRIADTDVFGQEVNAASKLGEDIARASEVLVTDALRVAVGNEMPGISFERLDLTVPGSSENFRVTY